MEMNVKYVVFLIFGIFCGDHGYSISFEGVTDLLSVESKVFAELLELWGEIGVNEGGVRLPFLPDKQSRIINNITGVSRQVDKLSKQLQRTTQVTLDAIFTEIPDAIKLQLHLNDLSNDIYSIDATYEYMKSYMTDMEIGLEQMTLESLATYIVSHSPYSVRGLMDKIHHMIVPRGYNVLNRGILIPLMESLQQEAGTNVCNLQQSPQQLLYNLYTTVALTELKGYAMMQFSWMLLKLYNKGNFIRESQMLEKQYMDRKVQKITNVKNALRGASRELWRCDPKQHISDKTYVEVTRLLQGYIQNEVDMNSESTCRENCAYYSYAKSHGCYQNQFCARQPKCNGKLINCRYIDSDMWVCLADRAADRRYDWIKYENGRVLGDMGYCTKQTTKVDSWWRWIFWHCSYCFCLCEEQGPKSDRYFNLRPVIADVDKNMVVTGIRFVKVNRVIHLQIQQASLVPHGGINTNSVHWRPIDDYKISDWDVLNGEDYFTLSWEQRAIDLDDLLAPEGHVLTGIRFRRVRTHLNLEIMVTPIDFTKGTLIKPKERSIWIGNNNFEYSRTALNLKNPDVPTRSYGSKPDSKSNQLLHFTHSDIDTDAAQTTVPFIDAQEAVPDPPTLLAGAGIFHKGETGYGGFIAPKVMTYDYMRHITADFSNDIRRKRQQPIK